MLEFLSDADPGDEGGYEVDEIGEDLEGGYQPDYKPIHFIDPGAVLAMIGLFDKEIITKEEVRELLGFDAEG